MAPTQLFALLATLLGSTTAFQHPPARRLTRGPPVSPSALRLGPVDSDPMATRRSFGARALATTVAGAAPWLSPVAPARAADATAPYDDADYGFRLEIPAGWETTEQTLSGRRKGVFFTDPAAKGADGTVETFGLIAYTQVRDDFTSIASFGSVEEVAQATIMPKGELAGGKGEEGASQMLSASKKGTAYYFDYVATPVVPTEPGSGPAMTRELKQQHFRTIFTLLPPVKGAGMTLVTITLQTTEERYGGVKGVIDKVINSFGKIPS